MQSLQNLIGRQLLTKRDKKRSVNILRFFYMREDKGFKFCNVKATKFIKKYFTFIYIVMLYIEIRISEILLLF